MGKFRGDDRKFLRFYLFSHWKKVLFAFFCSLLLCLSSCCLAYLIGPSLTFVLQEKKDFYHLEELLGSHLSYFVNFFFTFDVLAKETLLEYLAFSLIFFAILKALTTIVQAFLWVVIGEKIAFDIRVRFFSLYVLSHPHRKAQFEESGFEKNIATLITTDVKLYRDYLVTVWGGISRELIQAFGLCIGLVFLSPILFFSFVFCLIPVFYLFKKVGKKLTRRSSEAIAGYSLLSEWLQERFLGLETIKARRTEAYEIKKMQKLNQELFDKHYKLAYTESQTGPLLEMLAVCALIVILFVALFLIQKELITSSVVFSFFAVVVILSQSIDKLGRYFNRKKASIGSKRRIFKYLKILDEIDTKIYDPPSILKTPTNDELVVCQELSFFYKNRVSSGVKSFSYSFLRGRFYCITGPSGCGKSTLLKCLLGLLPLRRGKIYYDKSLLPLEKIAYISQKISLPPVSLAECVSYPLETIDEEKLVGAFKKVNLYDAVLSLDQGYNTILGDEISTGFSGGQNQKLFLARLFYHTYSLILIDEGTASLDPVSEDLFCLNLLELVKKEKTTVVFVSHSQAVMKYADDIIYMT